MKVFFNFSQNLYVAPKVKLKRNRTELLYSGDSTSKGSPSNSTNWSGKLKEN